MRTIQLEIDERQLANGLTLLAVQNPGVETFAAGVVLDVDRRDEAKGEEGLANLLGDCLEEGTKRLTAVQLAEAIDSLGGTVHGSASGGSMHCPATEARKMLRLLAEVVHEPALPARGTRRVQQEVLNEIRADMDDPQTVASHRFRHEVYGGHPFARPIRGTLRSVAGFGPKDLRRFHRRWFRPTGGYIAAAGPAPPEQTLDMLAKIFRGLGDKPAEHQRPQPPAMLEKVRDIHLPMKREQVHVYLGHPGIRRQNPDFYSLLVMDHILGTGPGFTSRISKRLRDEDGLCYSVHASITSSAGEEPGCFTAYIGTSAEHRQKATRGFLQEIDRIRQEHVAAEELHDVQEYLTGSFVFALERNANLARYAIRAKRFGLGFDYVHRYPELIRSVTIEDVQTAAQRYLHPDRVVIVSAGAS
jgi:zinc protease